MPKKEFSLEDLKKEYKKLGKNYNLPDFDILNENFSIEKATGNETDFLLREIRKIISERIFGHLRIVETLLNPSNAPMFVLSIVKNLGSKEKEKLTETYKELAKNEVELIKLDLEYSEEKEAEFIKNSLNIWNKARKELLEVLEVIEENWNKKPEGKKQGYFG